MQHLLKLNLINSQLICFSRWPRHKKEQDELNPFLNLFGTNVTMVTEITFLGVIFDFRLTWEPQFRKMTAKAYKRLNLLRHLSSLWKKPSPNTMMHLYSTIIRPIFEYGSICFVNAAGIHIEKIQLLQNHALRVVTKSPQYMSIKDLHDCTGTPYIKNHLITHARKQLHTMRQNSPIICKVIQDYDSIKHIQMNPSTQDVLR